MPSSYSNLLRLLKQATGENSNTWGDLVNSGFLELVEDSIAGTAQVDVTAGTGSYTLVTNNGVTDEARSAILQFIGSPSVDKTVIIPTSSKIYVVWSDLSTNKTLTISTGAGTTTSLAQNKVDIIVVTEDGVKSLLSEQLKSSNNLSDVASASSARTNLGLGTASTLAFSTDGTLASNSDSLIPTQKAVKTYAATASQGAKADTALQPADFDTYIAARRKVTDEQTVVAGTGGSVSHGLGTTPVKVSAYLVCKATDLGFAVGDRLMIPCDTYDSGGVQYRGVQVWVTSTDIKWRVGASGLILHNATTGASTAFIIPSKWRLVIVAEL